MAKPRTPTAKALVTGAATTNPGRFAPRVAGMKGRKPLGEPPKALTPEQRAAWLDFARDLPWLAGPHRAILHLTCVLRCRIESGGLVGVNALSTYSALLSKLGASPTDDSRVYWPDEGNGEDELDRYFAKGGKAQ